MRVLFVAVGALFLSGCALPPAIQIVSLGANVVSYASSGKSLSDHGISYAVQKDCALHRAIEGPVCKDESQTIASQGETDAVDMTDDAALIAFLATEE